MKRLLVAGSLFVCLSAPWWSSAEAVDSIAQADATAIHMVVQSQLEALAQDDAASAFALASSEKRTLIGTADRFLRLIKEEYNPIYRYQRAIFSPPEILDGEAVQIVRVTDGYSKVWLAIFWVEQEEDGNWRIDGCQLLETLTVSV